MKYAIIRTGGKQYRVQEGDVIEIERLTDPVGESITFSEVLLYTADGAVKIGQPIVGGITVSGKILAEVRGPKIRVAKFKAKARSRRVIGHRQILTQVQIEVFGSAKQNSEKKTAKVETTEVQSVVKKPVRKTIKKTEEATA